MPDKSMAELIQTMQQATRWFRPDWSQRIAAAEQLGSRRALEATPALCALIDKNENSDLTQAAIGALGEIASVESTDFLIRMLDREVGKRYQSVVLRSIERSIGLLASTGASSAVQMLLGLWPRLPTSLSAQVRGALLRLDPAVTTPLLLAALDGAQGSTQDFAKDLLVEMATPDSVLAAASGHPERMALLAGVLTAQGNRAVPALVQALSSQTNTGETAERALNGMGAGVLPAFQQAWATAGEAGRQRMVRVLAKRGAEAAPTMVVCLVAGGAGEKELAAALQAMGEAAVLPLLAASNQGQVGEVLARMPDQVVAVLKRDKVGATQLRAALGLPNDAIRRAAVERLRAAGMEAIEPLLELWQSGSLEDARAAEEALVKIGDPVVTHVLRLLANSDGQVRRRVAALLARFQGPTAEALIPSLAAWKLLAEPPQAVRVGADGDVADLAEAVAQARDHGLIFLSSGIHTLAESLLIPKPLVIVGDGKEHSVIESNSANTILRAHGMISLFLSDVTIRHTGKNWNAIVSADDGVICLHRCRITSTSNREGTGILIEGEAQASIRWCDCMQVWRGIGVAGNGSSVLQDNNCSHNSAFGIFFSNSGPALAQRNQCNENGTAGIRTNGESHPILEDNRCVHNGKYGIWLNSMEAQNVTGNHCEKNGDDGILVFVLSTSDPFQVSRNQCIANGIHGIEVESGCSDLVIGQNICRGNPKCGIQGDTNAAIIENQCVENGTGIGIFSEDNEYSPRLVGNTCRDNHHNGIVFSFVATGTASNNVCIGNSNGIAVMRQARPMLEGNTCERNSIGILFQSESAGTARRNRCHSNGNGIEIDDRAHPQLVDNDCRRNEKVGIGFFDSSSGMAQGNTCVGNLIGLFVNEVARPQIGRNGLSGNKMHDISDTRN